MDITDVNDVFQLVKYHFENGENRVCTRAGSNPISHYKFFSHLMADTPIRRPTEDKVFNSLEGISSNYQFVVHNRGLVYQRKQSCWCIWCISKMHSSLCWAETYAIPNCLSRGQDTTTMYGRLLQKKLCEESWSWGRGIPKVDQGRNR